MVNSTCTNTQSVTDITPTNSSNVDTHMHTTYINNCRDTEEELFIKEEKEEAKMFWHNPRSINYNKKHVNNLIKKVIRNQLPIKHRHIDNSL